MPCGTAGLMCQVLCLCFSCWCTSSRELAEPRTPLSSLEGGLGLCQIRVEAAGLGQMAELAGFKSSPELGAIQSFGHHPASIISSAAEATQLSTSCLIMR